MANLAAPPKQKSTAGKGAPPPETKPSANLHKSPPATVKDLSFKVPYEFWKDYKLSAMEEGMTMTDYLRMTHDYFKEHGKNR
jgi:hypothetical protein